MEVQKVDNISHQEFMNRFYNPGIPVVFKSASKAWKASTLFTPDYFRSHFGERETKVNDQNCNIREILHWIENSSPANPAPYPIKFDIPDQLPELMNLITPLGMNYAKPNWFESKAFPRKFSEVLLNFFLGDQGGNFRSRILICFIPMHGSPNYMAKKILSYFRVGRMNFFTRILKTPLYLM